MQEVGAGQGNPRICRVCGHERSVGGFGGRVVLGCLCFYGGEGRVCDGTGVVRVCNSEVEQALTCEHGSARVLG